VLLLSALAFAQDCSSYANGTEVTKGDVVYCPLPAGAKGTDAIAIVMGLDGCSLRVIPIARRDVSDLKQADWYPWLIPYDMLPDPSTCHLLVDTKGNRAGEKAQQ
jgi:hypothetical protein